MQNPFEVWLAIDLKASRGPEVARCRENWCGGHLSGEVAADDHAPRRQKQEAPSLMSERTHAESSRAWTCAAAAA